MYWGYMSILVPNSHLTLCFDFCSKVYTCGGSAGWRQVVYLDMSDNLSNAPQDGQRLLMMDSDCAVVLQVLFI